MVENILVDIVLVVFGILVLICVRPIAVRDFNKDYLSIDNTKNLKGIMAVAIVLHHLSEQISSGYIFPFMQHMGYLIVSVFFFLSGFGVLTQFKKNKEYLQSIWEKRILFLFIVLVLDTALYFFASRGWGKNYRVIDILQGFLKGHLIAGATWYLVSQIVFYVLFALTFSIHKKEYVRIISCTVLVLAYTVVLGICKFPSFWLYSNLAFIVGVIWASYFEQINKWLIKKNWIALVVSISMFLLFSLLPLVNSSLYTICRILSATAFAVMIVLFLGRIRIKAGIWSKVGSVSMEIYLIHIMVYNILRGTFIYVKSDVLYVVLSLIGTALISIPMYYFNKFLRKVILR